LIPKLAQIDFNITKKIRLSDDFSHPLRKLAVIFAHSGDSWLCLLVLGTLWGFGGHFWKPRALAFALGFVLTGATAGLIKLIVRRPRPDGKWGKIYRMTDPQSFPSGHAARSISLAVIATGTISHWTVLLLFPWAFLVSLSRISLGVHNFSDIIAGKALGLVAGFIALKFSFIWFF